MFQRAFQGNKEALGLEYKSTLDSIRCMGNIFMEQGKLVEAEEAYQRALHGCEKTLGPEHTSTLRVVNNIGLLYRNQDKLAEAERMYMRAMQGYRKMLDLDDTPNVVHGLGRTYYYYCDLLRRKRLASCPTILPKLTEADEFGSKIKSLAHLCKRFGVLSPCLFGFLGRVLIWDGQAENAIIALEQQMNPECGGIICDGCRKLLGLSNKLFVCEVCLDINLCIECHDNYKRQGVLVKKFSESCQGHEFIAIPRENWVKPGDGIISFKGMSSKL